jgi:hypothetical protein
VIARAAATSSSADKPVPDHNDLFAIIKATDTSPQKRKAAIRDLRNRASRKDKYRHTTRSEIVDLLAQVARDADSTCETQEHSISTLSELVNGDLRAQVLEESVNIALAPEAYPMTRFKAARIIVKAVREPRDGESDSSREKLREIQSVFQQIAPSTLREPAKSAYGQVIIALTAALSGY